MYFPPELIHNVVEFLADDQQALYNSALTSYSFLHPSRKYIFRQILLRSFSGQCRPARRLLNFLSASPHLVSYITSLRVMLGHRSSTTSGWFHEDDALPVIFVTLTRLQELTIESTSKPLKWRTVPLVLQNAVVEVVGRSTLSQFALIQVEDFPIHPLRTSWNLKNILLHSVTLVGGTDVVCSPSTPVSSTLESLHIVETRESKISNIRTWTQNPNADCLACLKRLSLNLYGKSAMYSQDIAIISRLLDICSPSLEQLKISCPPMFPSLSDPTKNPFYLPSMPKLRRLEFGLEISAFDDIETSRSLFWLTELFSNLPPTNVIEDVVLKCEILQSHPLGEFDNRIWTKLDKIFTSAELTRLRHVTLILYPIPFEAKQHSSISAEFLEQEMRILRKRHILQIEKRYSGVYL